MSAQMAADLAELEPYLFAMARSKATDMAHMAEDVAQEALIAAWQEWERHPGAPKGHAVRSAQFRVAKVLGGKPFTGEPRHPGRQDAHDAAAMIPLTATNGDGETYLTVDLEDLAAARDLEVADVRGIVADAVASLPDAADRESVRLRFWADMEWRDVATRVGRPPGTVMRRWTDIVRPHLREYLEEAFALAG